MMIMMMMHDGTRRLQQEDRAEAMISVPRTRL